VRTQGLNVNSQSWKFFFFVCSIAVRFFFVGSLVTTVVHVI